jgi:protein-S-isoprenylcysteine O-methyltransferase Ste14
MIAPERVAFLLWGLWIVSWWAAALWRRQTVQRAGFGAEFFHLIITMLGFAMLLTTPIAGRWATRRVMERDPAFVPLWHLETEARWALVGAIALGFLFCWWARITLGSLWSGTVTRKDDHYIVDTGPYALVRHPIYTGLILAAFATAALWGAVTNLAGAVLITLGFSIKAGIEERFLRRELGREAYDAYAARTPMLIPRLWPSPAKS